MFFVLWADRCFLVSQKQADNETSGCLPGYFHHTTSSSSVSIAAFDAFSTSNDPRTSRNDPSFMLV
jgi:hypothetical protein